MKTYAIGDRIKLDSGEVVQVTALQPCGPKISRPDTLYSFANGLTLTGREVVLNTKFGLPK